MEIHIDEDKCTGHGVCEGIRDDVFEVGDDGVVHLLIADLTEVLREDLEDACDQCPTQALRLED